MAKNVENLRVDHEFAPGEYRKGPEPEESQLSIFGFDIEFYHIAIAGVLVILLLGVLNYMQANAKKKAQDPDGSKAAAKRASKDRPDFSELRKSRNVDF